MADFVPPDPLIRGVFKTVFIRSTVFLCQAYTTTIGGNLWHWLVGWSAEVK